MWTISRTYNFASAHRLEGHPKCGRLHGHNYQLEVFLSTRNIGRERWVMDYAQMDAIIKPIVEELDHRYIVSSENLRAKCPYAELALEREEAVRIRVERSTVENMSEWFFMEIRNALVLLDLTDMKVRIDIRESLKSTCTYTAD